MEHGPKPKIIEIRVADERHHKLVPTGDLNAEAIATIWIIRSSGVLNRLI